MSQTVLDNSESGTIEQFLDEFRNTIDSAVVRLKAIPEETAAKKENETDWSQKQVLGHLIDSAANNHQRFVRAHSTNHLVFDGYKQDEWVEVQQYNSEPWQDLITLWAAYNRHLIHVIGSLPSETLTRTRVEHNLDQIAFKLVDKSGPTTLEYFVRDYVEHLRHHLAQIFDQN
jgi:hypothetical protein